MRFAWLLAALALTAGCGGSHAPTDLIRVKMVAMAEVAEREVTIKPDGEGAAFEVREIREPQDIKDKTAQPVETKRAGRMSEADYRALWKGFPKGKVWTLKDEKPPGGMHSLPVYHLELALADRKVKAVVEGPELLADKAALEIIQAVWKAAGVK
jgi:hypothetical protein